MSTASSQKPCRFYALQDDGHCDLLMLGSNVIGRSPAEVEGLSFISMESPRGAVSRMQATIEIAPNGDAWLSDCGSTNGTYISIRPGTGIRLEPHRFYQLTPGCTVVFGDVERKFVQVDEKVAAKVEEAKSRATSTAKSTPTKGHNEQRDGTDRRATAVGSVSEVASHASGETSKECRDGVAFSDKIKTSSREATEAKDLRDVPYLAELQPRISASDAFKRPREDGDSSGPRSALPKTETSPRPKAKSAVALPNVKALDTDALQPVVVCTSGLEPEDKSKARKAAKRHGATLTDDITEATLLVVGTPAVRTPKFIIAVARRIPIVATACLEQTEPLTRQSVFANMVSLKDNGRTYTASNLRAAIGRDGDDPLLAGLCFHLHELRGKAKQVAQEVITGCGGTVTKRKTDPGVRIDSEKELNDLYDHILRGRRP